MLALRLLLGLAQVTVGNSSFSWLYSSVTSLPRKILVCRVGGRRPHREAPLHAFLYSLAKQLHTPTHHKRAAWSQGVDDDGECRQDELPLDVFVQVMQASDYAREDGGEWLCLSRQRTCTREAHRQARRRRQ